MEPLALQVCCVVYTARGRPRKDDREGRVEFRLEIPAFKIRGQWRIKRTDLDLWMDAQPRGGDGGRDGD